jgi:hypothetical protein
MNKYEKWYAAITKRGQERILETYTEKHHILPRSLGGSNAKSNITYLTAREHFICHWLLIKIYKEGEAYWKMLNAIRIMRAENAKQNRYSTKITSRVYENLKEEYARLQSDRYKGENNPMYGREVSDKVRKGRSDRATKDNPAKRLGVGAKISKAKTGVKREEFSDEWKSNMSAAKIGENNNRYGVEVLDITKEKIRQKAIGRKQSEETIKKKADAIRGTKREKKLCPHCNQEVAVNGYARWHGDNCKR